MFTELRKKVSTLKLILHDKYEVWVGRRNPMTPPARLVHINAGDAEKIGNAFLKYFIELGGLKNTDDVLDVGSGFGRMAVPLTRFLSSSSHYEGMEIIDGGVEWCTRKITPRFKNFHFTKIDVKNNRYNPEGTVKASDLKFPFNDESFDFIILTSVFTHMLPSDVDNYLSEISRVLKKDGRSFITYFLLNDISLGSVKNGNSQFHLKYSFENCKIESEEDPEYVVAYSEDEINALYKKHHLEYSSVYYGNWSGRKDGLSFQDIVIGEKH